jgi:hypothetical protein
MRFAFTLLVALAVSRVAAADPTSGRVWTTPTAWLPAGGAVYGTAGTHHSGDGIVEPGLIQLGIGLGDLASVEIGGDNDVQGCTTCPATEGMWLGRAAFRLGAKQDAWFTGMPALVLGVRTTFAARGHVYGGARVTDAYVVASRELGQLRVHAGAVITEAGFDENEVHLAPTLRPLAGLEWTPSIYPRSSLMADLMYVPRFEPDRIAEEWVAGMGVRYQALAWGAVELGIKHRQDAGLADLTVMIRVHGVWDRGGSGKTRDLRR